MKITYVRCHKASPPYLIRRRTFGLTKQKLFAFSITHTLAGWQCDRKVEEFANVHRNNHVNVWPINKFGETVSPDIYFEELN